jgi:hypothetical protein
MRIHSRLLLGMFGLALAVPTVSSAAPFGDDAPASTAAAAGGTAAQAQPQTHHHHGLFGRRHCVECQRAYVKAHDGVDVPAPPPIEAGAMMHGQVIAGPVMAGQGGSCSTCQGNAVVMGPVLTADAHAPGYAVVGGPGAMASADASGYAVVGGEGAMGQDPAPIGLSRSAQGSYGGPRMAAAGARPGAAGPYDPSVVPTSIPPGQVAVPGPEHEKRYKIIAHAIGMPKFGRRRREQEDQEREKHAAIAYDQAGSKVTELPASMVYGPSGH